MVAAIDIMMTLLQHHPVVRTQVYLTKAQHRALRREARDEGISMTEVLRRLIDRHLEGGGGLGAFAKEDVLAFVGLGESGRDDGSERHDDALDEAFGGRAVR